MEYFSTKSVEQLKADMQLLFEQNRGFNFSVNMAGSFTGSNQFTIKPKMQLGVKNGSTFIKGQFSADGSNGTIIKCSLIPNTTFSILFVVCILVGFLLIGQVIKEHNHTLLWIGLPSTWLLAPAVVLGINHFTNEGLRQTFETTFDLSPVAQ